ncbi:MAG: hypothetical protein SGJ20_13960 [Planctomycetota bacterium]|nr:hypothetical protein [Planctomycetota bacterium]
MPQTLSTVVGIIELAIESDRLSCFIDAGLLSDGPTNWRSCEERVTGPAHNFLLLEANLPVLRQELERELRQLRDRLRSARHSDD